MIFYWLSLICVYHKNSNNKSKSKDKYSYVLNILKTQIPISRSNKNARNNKIEMKKAFDNKGPFFNETRKLINSSLAEFNRIGMHILHKFGFYEITQCQIVEAMKENIHFFSYAVLEMRKHFPEDFESVKRKFVQQKTNGSL